MSLTIDRTGAVTLLTLNRPKAANAVSIEMAVDIAEAIDAFADDETAKVLVVTGAGERAFCAGGDIATLSDATSHRHADRAGPLGFARLDPGKPTIAAVNGYCFGGGMELAAWCDFRIASENAEFGALNRQWGVTLIDGGTQRLPRIVGYGNAMYLVLTGARINASRALEIGLVQEVVPHGAALPRAMQLAQVIAEHPAACSPRRPGRRNRQHQPSAGRRHPVGGENRSPSHGRAKRRTTLDGVRLPPTSSRTLRTRLPHALSQQIRQACQTGPEHLALADGGPFVYAVAQRLLTKGIRV